MQGIIVVPVFRQSVKSLDPGLEPISESWSRPGKASGKNMCGLAGRFKYGEK